MTAPRTPREDLKLIHSFTSDDPSVPQDARFRDWFGWRPSKGTRCPRVLAGKRCHQYSYADNNCICVRLYHPLLDHPRRWITGEGDQVLTAEPYEFEGDAFAELVTECASLGLEVSARGTSPYFPGRTMLLIIRKR